MRQYLYFSISIVLLILGFLVYYFFRPEIVIIQFFTAHFHLPLHRGNPGLNKSLINFATGHLTDILWYASLLLMLLAFIEKNIFKSFYIFFITLPFILEILQGFRIIPGTFDWLDIFYYFLTFYFFYSLFPSLKTTFMKYNFLKSLFPIGILGAFIAFAVGSAPSSKVTYTTGKIQFPQKSNDIFTKPSLIKYLQSTSNPTIVLRVPNQVDNVLEENKQLNKSQIYNTIETELAKANFIVRDRALYQKVLDQNTAVDYSKIKELTDTDLILELVSYEQVNYNTNTYTDRKERQRVTDTNLKVPGVKVEFKLIQVKDNDLVGEYTFNYAPCTSGCLYTFDNLGNLYNPADLNRRKITPYEYVTSDQLETFFQGCTQQLIRNLKPM